MEGGDGCGEGEEVELFEQLKCNILSEVAQTARLGTAAFVLFTLVATMAISDSSTPSSKWQLDRRSFCELHRSV